MIDALKNLFFKKSSGRKFDRVEQLKKRTLRKLSRIAVSKKRASELFDEAVKEFFAEYFGMHKEFTSSDVLKTASQKRIKKEQREKIKVFCETFDAVKFSSNGATSEELSSLKNLFESILNSL